MPDLLTDLLDTRLGALTGTAWRVARTLGVADRALTSDLVADASSVGGGDLNDALHALKRPSPPVHLRGLDRGAEAPLARRSDQTTSGAR